MSAGRKKTVILLTVLGAVVLIPFGVWQAATPQARLRAHLSWPLWPSSKERLGTPAQVPNLLRIISTAPESDALLRERAGEVISEMGGEAVEPLLECLDDGMDASFDRLMKLDLRALEPLLKKALEPGMNIAAHQFIMITASQAASSPQLSPGQLNRTIELLEELALRSEDQASTAAFCLGFWIYDDGEVVRKLSRSTNPRLRLTAAIAAAKGLERKSHRGGAPRDWQESMHKVTEHLLSDADDKVSSTAAYAVRDFDFSFVPKSAMKSKLKSLQKTGGPITRARAASTLRQGALR